MYFREDGFMSAGATRNGSIVWLSPKAFQRNKIGMVYINLKKRCKEQGLPMNVDRDYLLSIFPEDFRCPVSGDLMIWGNEDGTNNSPSLDKIFPELGYVKGNLVWVANHINKTKSNKPLSYFQKMVDYYLQFDLATVQERIDIESNNVTTIPETKVKKSYIQSGKQRPNSSGHIGISVGSNKKKWRAQISHNKKRINLGEFDTIEQAIEARQNAFIKYGYDLEDGPKRGRIPLNKEFWGKGKD